MKKLQEVSIEVEEEIAENMGLGTVDTLRAFQSFILRVIESDMDQYVLKENIEILYQTYTDEEKNNYKVIIIEALDTENDHDCSLLFETTDFHEFYIKIFNQKPSELDADSKGYEYGNFKLKDKDVFNA